MGTPTAPDDGLPTPKITEHVDARARAKSSRNDTRIAQENVRARTIHNTVDNSARSKTFVIGGGVVLAVVLAIIWWQWTRSADVTRAEQEYRALARSVCERIVASATPPIPNLDASTSGPAYDQAVYLAYLDGQATTIADQGRRLADTPPPARLATQQQAVVQSATTTAAALDALVPTVMTYGEQITQDEIQAMIGTPAGAELAARNRELSDALDDLSGQPCSGTSTG